ncbi:enoyl-CoA hydratase/isomerase family protein [Burkholderia cenocepacia]
MSVEDIQIERHDGVVTLRLNRPAKRNSLARPHLDFLRETLEALANDPAVRCVVLTGTGSAFCAGADVDEWAEAERNGELDTYGWTERAHRFVQALAAFPRPTIAALNGSTVGAGTDIGFACDFRIASTAATLRCGYTGMGYSPDMGGSWFLPRLARPDVVRRFIFLNERWNAQDALAAGLCPRSSMRTSSRNTSPHSPLASRKGRASRSAIPRRCSRSRSRTPSPSSCAANWRLVSPAVTAWTARKRFARRSRAAHLFLSGDDSWIFR